jgi:hypothetical protein
MTVTKPFGELTGCPAKDVIVSPSLSPALAAGEPDAMDSITAPVGSPELEDVTPTPKKAVGPMCTVDDECPWVIASATLRAELIGIE